MNTMQNKLRMFLVSITLTLVGFDINAIHAKDDIEGIPKVNVTIKSSGKTFGNCIQMSFRNTLDHDIYLAAWDVGAENELTKNLFKVLSPENKVYPYSGKLIKRSEPSLSDLVLIPSGAEVEFSVNLSKYYQVSNSIGKISYKAYVPIYTVRDGEVRLEKFIQLTSNEIKP